MEDKANDQNGVDVRSIAKSSPWFPVTAHPSIMLAWHRAIQLVAVSREYEDRLYYATRLDNFPPACHEDEESFFERMGVSSWDSVIGGMTDAGQHHGLVFVADIDLDRIGAAKKPIHPAAEARDLRR
jgi:hypothetical protein